jgi:lipopolysaccharide transport system permease protein
MAARAQAIVIRPADSAWPNIAAHLRRLFEYGDLLRTLSIHRINVRYRQTRLGVGWAVLPPLLMMTVIDAFRDVLLLGQQPDGTPLGYAVLVTACALPIAYLVFKRAEATMADIV